MTFHFNRAARDAATFRNGSLYTRTARFDVEQRALTEDELRRIAPSIFAVDAHASRSARFAPIPTIEVIRGLRKEGFEVVGARQSTTRDASKIDFTKHLLRLRRLDGKNHQVGDTVAEILLKNANDGTAAYDLMAGMFRIACLNSLVTQTGTIDSVKVKHSGKNVLDDVIEGTYRVLDETAKVIEAPARWAQLQLDRAEQQAFANAAHVLRFGDAEGNVTTAIQPAQLLAPRRQQDTGRDLWTTFNVTQENAIKGGLTAMGRDANNRPRRTTTRGVNGIDQDVKLNKALWVLAEQMAALKG